MSCTLYTSFFLSVIKNLSRTYLVIFLFLPLKIEINTPSKPPDQQHIVRIFK